MKIGTGLLALALFGQAGCLNDAEPSERLYNGTYHFVAVRGDGSVEAEGTFVARIQDDGSVSGTWTVEGMTGEGDLMGFRTDDGVFRLNFHPQYADHNFFLNGRPSGQRFDGTWQWVGIMGVMKEGTFKALHE